MSLGNRSRLASVVECPSGWLASEGLFISPALAWKAVEQFLVDGSISNEIAWIEPGEIPEGGNW